MDSNSGWSTPSSVSAGGAASSLPLSPSFFDALRVDEDDDNTFDLGASPGSRRCPTFKEYAEKIKRLQKDNFQLRVRIYLSEQKSGMKTSSSDLAVIYAQCRNALVQNGDLGAADMLLSPSSHSTAQTATSTVSISNELDKVKTDKGELEEKLRAFEELLAKKDQEISELNLKNEELSRRNAGMSAELDKLNESLAGKRNSEAELEKLACLAFGGSNNDMEVLNEKLESKLADKTSEVVELEAELQVVTKKLESSDKRVHGLKSDVKEYERRIQEMSEALKDLGRKYARLDRENGKLRKLTDKTNENALSRMAEEVSSCTNPEKFSAIKQLVGMLQGRMRELTNFVETLLQLESKKVFTLTGLTNENRENLFKAIEQCRMFSKNLDLLFEDNGSHHFSSPNSSFSIGHSSHGHRHERHRHHSSSTESYRGMFSPQERHRSRYKSAEVQCSILDSSLINSVESANAYINKLKQDIGMLESINSQLGAEKTDLISQVKSLESSVSVLRITNHPDKSATAVDSSTNPASLKLKEENRKLLKRLAITEEALRNLHVQHAKLVGELKLLRSQFQKESKSSGGTTVVESDRPVDSTSPDLGIDSGHDGAVNSDDSNSTNYKEEARILRTTNRELALKLKQTRQALDITLEKLNATTKEKEQVEKAICRQLHKTHTILRQAKKSVEKFTNTQCQENIAPAPTPP